MIKPILDLKTLPQYKWIYEEAKRRYKFDDSSVIFAIDNNIYCDSIPPSWLVEHELTHIRQQEGIGFKAWWERCFSDIDFKYKQELEAHQVEFQAYKKLWGRQSSRDYAKVLTHRMNSSLYKFPYKTTIKDITC